MNFNEYKDKKGDKKILDSLSKKLMEEIIHLTNEGN